MPSHKHKIGKKCLASHKHTNCNYSLFYNLFQIKIIVSALKHNGANKDIWNHFKSFQTKIIQSSLILMEANRRPCLHWHGNAASEFLSSLIARKLIRIRIYTRQNICRINLSCKMFIFAKNIMLLTRIWFGKLLTVGKRFMPLQQHLGIAMCRQSSLRKYLQLNIGRP